MRKNILITALALLVFTLPVLAATTDFTADGNIVVSGVTIYEGGLTDDLLILTTSTAESFNFNSGVFTVTNPGTFKIGSSNSTVKSIYVKKSGSAVACAVNSSPGSSYVTLPTTAADYIVYPSTATNFATSDCCSTVSHAATYNAFPTCGPATCNGGYYVSGSSCVQIGGGGILGGGGGGYSTIGLATPTPSVSVSPSPSPSTSPAASPAATPTPQTIKEGTMIRAIGDVDVYIVKYVGDKKFKRLILSPSVFNSYKHLKWTDVMDVEKSVVDAYTTSELVRAVGDPKVYKLYPAGDTGQKRWIKTAAGFNRMGFDWDAVYEINAVDRNSYTTGIVIE